MTTAKTTHSDPLKRVDFGGTPPCPSCGGLLTLEHLESIKRELDGLATRGRLNKWARENTTQRSVHERHSKRWKGYKDPSYARPSPIMNFRGESYIAHDGQALKLDHGPPQLLPGAAGDSASKAYLDGVVSVGNPVDQLALGAGLSAKAVDHSGTALGLTSVCCADCGTRFEPTAAEARESLLDEIKRLRLKTQSAIDLLADLAD